MASRVLQEEHERYARVERVRLGGAPVEVEWMPYGGAGSAEAATEPPEIVAGYGLLELEYAAFRRGAAVVERSCRGTVAVRGGDRIEFLNRMVTQELKGMAAGDVRTGFWLNRKGRIEADLVFAEVPAAVDNDAFMLIDLDVHDAARTVTSLTAFLFNEDVHLADQTAEWGRLAVHGPEGAMLLSNAGADDASLEALNADLRCVRTQLAGVPAVLVRRDQCGSPGVEVFVPASGLARVWDALVSQHDATAGGRRRARPAGWHAYNIARIEAGTPLHHVDFGTESLPHESGVIGERVSFRKGCYLGQEVVARMESLGKPKQRLVGLRIAEDALPVAGSPVFELGADGAPGNPVGSITSSTLSPMLGASSVAFAMVRTAHAEPGTVLGVPAEGVRATATVQPRLRFLAEGG
ncbi:MAG: YgfZ/GcvT domain-containing protein [Phycisphaerales bacterium]|jgi:folate-binding protein YgfZ